MCTLQAGKELVHTALKTSIGNMLPGDVSPAVCVTGPFHQLAGSFVHAALALDKDGRPLPFPGNPEEVSTSPSESEKLTWPEETAVKQVFLLLDEAVIIPDGSSLSDTVLLQMEALTSNGYTVALVSVVQGMCLMCASYLLHA